VVIFTGLHGPVPQGQSLARIGLTEVGEDPQNITGPQDRAPPLNLGDLLPKTVPGVSSNIKRGRLPSDPCQPSQTDPYILKWQSWFLTFGLSHGPQASPQNPVTKCEISRCGCNALPATRRCCLQDFQRTPRTSLPTWLQFWVPPRSLRVRGLLTTQGTGSRWQYLATETGPRPMALCSQSASQPGRGPCFVVSCASAHCI